MNAFLTNQFLTINSEELLWGGRNCQQINLSKHKAGSPGLCFVFAGNVSALSRRIINHYEIPRVINTLNSRLIRERAHYVPHNFCVLKVMSFVAKKSFRFFSLEFPNFHVEKRPPVRFHWS